MKKKVGDFSSVLSPLESDVLKVLWPNKKLKVRQIFDKLKGSRKVALSSVAVICDRLHAKQIVDRQIQKGRGGVRYVYFPRHNKKGFEKSIVEDAVNSLIKRFGPTAVSYFNERFATKKR